MPDTKKVIAGQMPTTETTETEKGSSNQTISDNAYANLSLNQLKDHLQQEKPNLKQLRLHSFHAFVEWCKNDAQHRNAVLRMRLGSTPVLLALNSEKLSQFGHSIILDTDSAAMLGRMNSLIKQEYAKFRKIGSICDVIKNKVEGSESSTDDYEFAEEAQNYVRTHKEHVEDVAKRFLQSVGTSN